MLQSSSISSPGTGQTIASRTQLVHQAADKLEKAWKQNNDLSVDRMNRIQKLEYLNNQLKDGYMNSIKFVFDLAKVFDSMKQELAPLLAAIEDMTKKSDGMSEQVLRNITQEAQALGEIDAKVAQNMNAINQFINTHANQVNQIAQAFSIKDFTLNPIK